MGDPAVIAIITTSPAAAGIAWKIYSEIRKIGHAVNGELESKLDKAIGPVKAQLAELGEDLRDLRADVRDVKAVQRDMRHHTEGDGR